MSEEIRRPSDTHRMSREDIEAALEAQRRDTLPLGVQEAIAEAQQLDAVVCPACGQGLVSSDVAERVAIAIGSDFDDAPDTDVTTQPTGPRGR